MNMNLVTDTDEYLELKPHVQRVLVIEDDLCLETIMTRLIQGIDPRIDVQWVATGEDALDLLGDRFGSGFDLIIADISLPGRVSGLDVWDACNKLFPDIGFMFISGMPVDEFLRSIGRNTICPPYIPKPIYPGECRDMIKEMLRHAHVDRLRAQGRDDN